MKPILLNTIALEPNRWTADKVPHYRLYDILEAAADHGFTAFEVWQYHLSKEPESEIDRIIDLANRRYLTFPVIGIYPKLHLTGHERKWELEEIENICKYAGKLHTHILKFFVGSISPEEITHTEYHDSVSFVKEMADMVEYYGLRLSGEIHENTLFGNQKICRDFLWDVYADNFKVCFQPLDFHDTDKTIDLYREMSKDVIHIHLQGRKNGDLCSLKDADIDYNRLFHVFNDSGFTGYYSLEFVKDCVVQEPLRFDMDTVLHNANADREFVNSLISK